MIYFKKFKYYSHSELKYTLSGLKVYGEVLMSSKVVVVGTFVN